MTPAFFRRPSLRSRLLFFFTLSLFGPVTATGVVAYFMVRSSLLSASFREQKELAHRLSDQVLNRVASVEKGLLTLAVHGRVARLKGVEQQRVLRELIQTYPDLMDVSLYDGQGLGLTRASRRGSRILWGPEPTQRTRREEFLMSQHHRYISPVFFTDRDRIPQLFLGVPSGAGNGVLLGRLSLAGVWAAVAESSTPVLRASIIDRAGRLTAHADPQRVFAHEKWGERPGVSLWLGEGRTAPSGPILWKEGGESYRTWAQKISELGWVVLVDASINQVLAPGRRLVLSVAGIALLMGMVFWVLVLSLVNRILQPLGQLEDGLEQIGRGDLTHRLDIRTGDELERVANALNGMAQSLEVLENTKRDLIHMIVHDLKNPLTGVLGGLDYVLLMSKDNLTPDQRKLLSLGAKSGRDLLRMIQNLLDLAKMEEGHLDLKREPFSMLELAGQCVDDLEAAIVKERKFISVEVDKNMPKIHADRDLIHRVLANLLTNALKHTPLQTEISIHVRLSEDKTALVTSVRDNGEGIPEEFQKRIFDKFSQAEGKKQNYRMGSGLGLTFCKMAMEAHDGKIWVESVRGHGSEFFFSLPLTVPVDGPAPSPEKKTPMEVV